MNRTEQMASLLVRSALGPLSDSALVREYYRIMAGTSTLEQQELALDIWRGAGHSTRCTVCTRQGLIDWSLVYPQFRCARHSQPATAHAPRRLQLRRKR